MAKDIPPYSVAVGNPCEVKRKRFDEDLIEYLLKINGGIGALKRFLRIWKLYAAEIYQKLKIL